MTPKPGTHRETDVGGLPDREDEPPDDWEPDEEYWRACDEEYERQIDELVYKLYDLTDDEIKIVENF